MKVKIFSFYLLMAFALSLHANPIDLKPTFTKGDRHSYYQTMKFNMENIVPNMGEMKMGMESHFAMTYDIKSVEEDGTALLQVTLDSINFKYTDQMTSEDKKEQQSDSNNTLQMELNSMNDDNNNPLKKFVMALEGMSYDIRVDSRGEIIDVEKNEKIENKAKQIASEVEDPSVSAFLSQSLVKIFEKKQLKEMNNSILGFYPPGPVKIGDTWKKAIQATPFNVDWDVTWTLTEVKNGKAIIAVDAPIEMKNSDSGTNVTVKGTKKGTIEVETKSGWLSESSETIQVDSTISTEGANAVPLFKMKGVTETKTSN